MGEEACDAGGAGAGAADVGADAAGSAHSVDSAE